MARLYSYLSILATALFILPSFALVVEAQENEPTIYTTEKLLPVEGVCRCEPDLDSDDLCEGPPDQFRVKFFRGPGTIVKGWPSKGGIYILKGCFGVELDVLGLDRFHNTPRPSGPHAAAEEEAHCDKNKKISSL